MGGPPRARGRRARERYLRRRLRRTPACAGTTRTACPTWSGKPEDPACAGTTCPGPPAAPSTTEDPRVRGDDVSPAISAGSHTGGPPRARGRPRRHEWGDMDLGRTPACAGTTAPAGLRPPRRAEDPRVRGDDASSMRSTAPASGGPPRARGRRSRGQGRRARSGRTPACAGTTSAATTSPMRTPEDPRVRGDDSSRSTTLAPRSGGPPRARGRHRGARRGAGHGGRTPACAGTTSASCGTADGMGGGPPRARGRPRVLPPPGRRRGRTPACAGTTSARCAATSATTEDPRVRGDDAEDERDLVGAIGGPPRARGRLGHQLDADVVAGRTPACAGTTRTGSGCPSGLAEDPRVRGDDRRPRLGGAGGGGGPPRARGRLGGEAEPDLGEGRTPACAGTTTPSRAGPRRPAEDPRVRGDDAAIPVEGKVSTGGPPRARGRRHRHPAQAGAHRRTPACAGTTPIRPWPPRWTPEDPRVRGDDWSPGSGASRSGGGPPRARGRPRPRAPEVVPPRRTPACAGTTACTAPTRCSRGEDPRVRGDDRARSQAASSVGGGPPRARGRRRADEGAGPVRGRTPACAGTTTPRPAAGA